MVVRMSALSQACSLPSPWSYCLQLLTHPAPFAEWPGWLAGHPYRPRPRPKTTRLLKALDKALGLCPSPCFMHSLQAVPAQPWPSCSVPTLLKPHLRASTSSSSGGPCRSSTPPPAAQGPWAHEPCDGGACTPGCGVVRLKEAWPCFI